jgi:hypothetical protein
MSAGVIAKQEFIQMGKQKSSRTGWAEVIEAAKAKLERTKLYEAQLEAIILWFQAQMEAGEPCPDQMSQAYRPAKRPVRK